MPRMRRRRPEPEPEPPAPPPPAEEPQRRSLFGDGFLEIDPDTGIYTRPDYLTSRASLDDRLWRDSGLFESPAGHVESFKPPPLPPEYKEETPEPKAKPTPAKRTARHPKKTPAKKTPAKKTTAKKTPTKRAPGRRASPSPIEVEPEPFPEPPPPISVPAVAASPQFPTPSATSEQLPQGLGMPPPFRSRVDWLLHGMGRQPVAVLAALLAGWTALIVALWVALLGLILGVLIAVGVIATTSFTRSLFHAGAGEALTFVGILTGAVVGAGGSFTAFYANSLLANPASAIVGIGSGALIAALIVWVISHAEHTFLRWRGYRRLSTEETRRIAPLVSIVDERNGYRRLPRFAMADLITPNAWAQTRTIVLTKGLLDTLNDNELTAVLAHELHHWAACDSVGLTWVWACALPVALTYNLGVWISGRDFKTGEPTNKRRGLMGVIGWLLLWPSWILTNLLIAPLVAGRQRRCEYEADQAAKRIGYGPALSSALQKLAAFESGRTGWEYAMTRTHPPTELRREALQPARPDDEEYVQEELGVSTNRIVGVVAAAMIVVVIGVGALVNGNRSSSASATTPTVPPTVPPPPSPSTSTSTSTSTTTTTVPPPPPGRPYGITSTIAIRTGPGTSFQEVGVAPQGSTVSVICTTPGETVNGPFGPDSHWDKVFLAGQGGVGGGTGFVSDEYVDTKQDIDNPALIPVC